MLIHLLQFLLNFKYTQILLFVADNFESTGNNNPPTVLPRTAANSKVIIRASKIPDAPK